MNADVAKMLALALGASCLPVGAVRAQEGQCYALSSTPPTYRTETRTVVAEAASERLMVIPAQYRSVTQTYVQVEEHCPGDVLRSVSETLVVVPANERVETVPATYRTITDTVEVEPAFEGWEVLPDGSVRRFEKEALRRTIQRRVIDRPASTRRVAVPAQTRTITRQVVASSRGCAASARIPAQLGTLSRRIVSAPASLRRVAVPGKTATRQTRVVDRPSSLALDPVSCEAPGTVLGPFTAPSAGQVSLALPQNARDGVVYRPVREAVPDPACVEWLPFSEDAQKVAREGHFPWPPPSASAWTVLPVDLFENRGIRRFGQAVGHIETALASLGYVERSYYDIPQGVAIVMRIEQIGDDARPIANRWSLKVGEVDPFSIGGYLSALLSAPQGRFRIIALLGTGRPVAATGPKPDYDRATVWFERGVNMLDPALADRCHDPDTRWTALVYEFEQKGAGTTPRLVPISEIGIARHLEGSGLVAALEQIP